ncbi:MAG: SUMF1/EgtB/PvdO family nonheme iron enzyme [Oscillospiraceae bacterium]
MRLLKGTASVFAASVFAVAVLSGNAAAADKSKDDGMNMFQNSDFIEKEQPELTEETKQLISLYQRNPTEENYLNLRDIVIENYNAVLDRKEEKLSSLKKETAGKPGGDKKVAEMEEIVQEMYMTYWNRINSSMLRFTDTRLLKWSVSNAARYEYIPVMGAGNSIYVKRTPVTNAEYAKFVYATGAKAPSNWVNGKYSAGEENYPVNFVSYEDAAAYCEWLTAQDGVNVYRLPNESEWELAAGHMPKDADFNCGVNDGRTSVNQYAEVTRGAHGAVDFWGNVWEWTSTVRSDSDGITELGVKGGAWNSVRTDCRTEHRKEGRDSSRGYEDVGFRVIKVLNGEEPEQKVELATLNAPIVTAKEVATGKIELSWGKVDEVVEYQIFEYCENTELIRMSARTSDTSFTVEARNDDNSYKYIVQPISYTAICDNVSAEYAVGAEEMQSTSDTASPSAAYDSKRNCVTIFWDSAEGVDSYYVYRYFPYQKKVSKPRLVTNRTECTFHNVTAGTTYYYVIAAEEIPNPNDYDGAFSVMISVT